MREAVIASASVCIAERQNSHPIARCGKITPDDFAKLFVIACNRNMSNTESRSGYVQTQERYPDELALMERLPHGQRLIIPRGLLWGRQREDEYSRKKRKLAEQEYREKGINFLYENPVIVVMLPMGKNGLQLVIIDGHHRVRYAPGFDIHDIPCLVFTPRQLVRVFNEGKSAHSRFNKESLENQLSQEVVEAMGSFRALPNSKWPSYLPGVDSIEGLKQRFPAFDAGTLRPGQPVDLKAQTHSTL